MSPHLFAATSAPSALPSMPAPRPLAPTANWSAPISSRARKKPCSKRSSSKTPSPQTSLRVCGVEAPRTMKILVANLGSTSFKYRLFDMADERLLARGGVERIGSTECPCFVEHNGRRDETPVSAKDHGVAVRLCLSQLADLRLLDRPTDLAGIGFKAVHARMMTGVCRVDDRVLAAMEAYNGVAPAHNPPYVKAMRLLAKELPEVPLVAAFETGFHQDIPRVHHLYAVPLSWQGFGIRRWGFHGASHRYIAERTGERLENPEAKIVSCHLGGSSSLCAIGGGKSRDTSMGMSPQSGLPQNNRVGDFDPFALPEIM